MVYIMDWFKLINFEEIVAWRRHMHQHPELSFQEVETSNYIAEQLEKMGNIEISRPTKTSVLGIIRGSQPGKTVALRADIDALPITEETDVPFKSQNPGVMHACGHDTHAAMLLGAARVLSQITDQFSGTIKLIFQHAEELTPGGAQEIIATGCLDDAEFIYGQHIIAPMPSGLVALLAGPAMAAQDSFHLMIQGRGAHGSSPDKSIDPILVGSDLVMNLNQIVSRNISPFENVVISVGRFSSGDVSNVIPDKAYIDGSVRTNSQNARPYVEERIRTVIDCICKAYGAEYELNYLHGYPALVNDKKATEIAEHVATKVLGEKSWIVAPKTMGSEDFAYYTYKAPSVFAFIGAGTDKDGCGFINHHPKFNVVEDAFIVGAKMHVGFALEVLGQAE